MSAFTVGRQAVTLDGNGDKAGGTPGGESNTGAFVKWIPGEAITFYAAILGVGSTQGDVPADATPQELLERIDAGSPAWFFVGAAFAVAFVSLGAVNTPAGSVPGPRASLSGSL